MKLPGVTVNVSNGNLMQDVAVADAVPALVATVKTTSLVGKTAEIYSLDDAVSLGYTESAEPFMYNLIKEYYDELGGKQLLYVYGIAQATTMTKALTATETNSVAKLLLETEGEVNLIAIARNPESGYSAGSGFLDKDVETAVTASKALAENYQSQNKPIRLLIEGRVANESASNTYSPSEAGNGYAGVVLGGTSADGSAAVSIALARAVKYPAHVKLGNGQNGPLSALQIYIGTKPMEERSDLETLHEDGFIVFMHRTGSAGYYFGVDNMCESGDYRILVHGRVIDKAQRIAAKAYLPFVENDMRMESDGSINASDAIYLGSILETAIRAEMSEQISNVKVNVPVKQDVINTSNVNIQISVLPLGYSSYLTINLGLTAKL